MEGCCSWPPGRELEEVEERFVLRGAGPGDGQEPLASRDASLAPGPLRDISLYNYTLNSLFGPKFEISDYGPNGRQADKESYPELYRDKESVSTLIELFRDDNTFQKYALEKPSDEVGDPGTWRKPEVNRGAG